MDRVLNEQQKPSSVGRTEKRSLHGYCFPCQKHANIMTSQWCIVFSMRVDMLSLCSLIKSIVAWGTFGKLKKNFDLWKSWKFTFTSCLLFRLIVDIDLGCQSIQEGVSWVVGIISFPKDVQSAVHNFVVWTNCHSREIHIPNGKIGVRNSHIRWRISPFLCNRHYHNITHDST